ncbi:hypothetical protein, partial [Klebsiella pneumoniae]|uniref:hypothetical protein n=1 Tax=Klebsiella pneumoniae TaxID=573 RepID=UPI00273174A1
FALATFRGHDPAADQKQRQPAKPDLLRPIRAELPQLRPAYRFFRQPGGGQEPAVQFSAYTVALQHRYLPQSTTEWLVGNPIDELTITEG